MSLPVRKEERVVHKEGGLFSGPSTERTVVEERKPITAAIKEGIDKAADAVRAGIAQADAALSSSGSSGGAPGTAYASKTTTTVEPGTGGASGFKSTAEKTVVRDSAGGTHATEHTSTKRYIH